MKRWKVIFKMEAFGNALIDADTREEAFRILADEKITSTQYLIENSKVIRRNSMGIYARGEEVPEALLPKEQNKIRSSEPSAVPPKVQARSEIQKEKIPLLERILTSKGPGLGEKPKQEIQEEVLGTFRVDTF